MLGDSAPPNQWLIQLAGRLQRQAAAVKRLSSATLYLDALSTVAVALFTQDALGAPPAERGRRLFSPWRYDLRCVAREPNPSPAGLGAAWAHESIGSENRPGGTGPSGRE